MKAKMILIAIALGIVLYLQFFVDFKDMISEEMDTVQDQNGEISVK